MPRTRVKICGVCRPEDAVLAAHAGADAIGMIFHPPSKRNVTPEHARAIASAAGPFVTPVGVFVDADPQQIIQTARHAGIHLIQLHGRESPEIARQLADAGLKVLKAIRADDSLRDQLDTWRSSNLLGTVILGLVLETPATAEAGGTGILNDFGRVAQHIAAGDFHGLPALIAAGGLTPQTVADVIRRIRPWAVDVSSGVEARLREKSPEQVRQFIAAVRAADENP